MHYTNWKCYYTKDVFIFFISFLKTYILCDSMSIQNIHEINENAMKTELIGIISIFRKKYI